jgi:hypothetical protein
MGLWGRPPAVIEKFARVLFDGAAERAWFEALTDLQASNPRALGTGLRPP